jgi:hypothetical protein
MSLHPSEAWLAEHRALIRQAQATGDLSILELLCRKAFVDGMLHGIEEMSGRWDRANDGALAAAVKQ